MSEFKLGKIQPTPRGEYQSDKAYAYLDIVTDGGSSYICRSRSGVPAGYNVEDARCWQLIAERGKDGQSMTYRVTDTHIQVKLESEEEWTDIIAITDLKGEKGAKGDTGPAGKDGEVTLEMLEERLSALPAADVDLSALETTIAAKADKTDLDELAVTVNQACDNIPVGFIGMFAVESAPEDWLVCDGSLDKQSDEPELFLAIGHKYTPDGKTAPAGYFYRPDYRDYFLRGHNPDGNRALGSEQGDAIRDINGSLNIPNGNAQAWDGNYFNPSGVFTVSGGATFSGNGSGAGKGGRVNFSAASAGVPIADEIRPVNKTVLICVKARKTPGTKKRTFDYSELIGLFSTLDAVASKIYTPTTPVRYALPLTTNTTSGIKSSYYWKNAEGLVTVKFSFFYKGSANNPTLAVLPAGYRPRERVYFVCTEYVRFEEEAYEITPHRMIVEPTGNIWCVDMRTVEKTPGAKSASVASTVSFYAEESEVSE